MTQWTGWLGLAYPWVKAAHVTFVIFWMAGLFLLPRLYVYHQESTPASPEDRAWIDCLHAIDAAALSAGRYPAANMIAALRHKGSASQAVFEPVSPQQHIDLTREQQMKASAASR